MNDTFSIDYRHSHGNLHIALAGSFSERCAEELADIVLREYTGYGRVFVDTASVNYLMEEAVAKFKKYEKNFQTILHNLYFKGEKGFQMAPSGSRVLIVDREKLAGHKCCGKCAHCTCGGKCKNAHGHHESVEN